MTPALRNVLSALCVLLLLYGLLLLMGSLVQIFAVLGATLLLTYVLMGPVDWVEDKLSKILPGLKLPRWAAQRRALSILLVYLFFAAMLGISALKAVPKISNQVRDFSNDLPVYAEELQDAISTMPQLQDLDRWIEQVNRTTVRSAQSRLNGIPLRENLVRQLGQLMQGYAANAWSYLVNLGTTTLATLIYGLTCLVMAFYFLHDGKTLKKGFVNLMPVRMQAQLLHYLDQIHSVLANFIKTQVLLSVLAGFYMYAVYSLLGIKYALFLSVLYAVASIVPVIGPWFAMLPTVLVVLFTDEPIRLLHILMFSTIYYFLKEYWWMPRLFQNRFEIHPVMIIITFLACLQIGGIPGILLAFPITGLLCGTFQYLVERQEKVN